MQVRGPATVTVNGLNMTEFTQDIGLAFVSGFGWTAGALAFVLVVILLGGVILWWMGR